MTSVEETEPWYERVPVTTEHTMATQANARRHELTGVARTHGESAIFHLYRECQVLLTIRREMDAESGGPSGKWMAYLSEYQKHRQIGATKIRSLLAWVADLEVNDPEALLTAAGVEAAEARRKEIESAKRAERDSKNADKHEITSDSLSLSDSDNDNNSDVISDVPDSMGDTQILHQENTEDNEITPEQLKSELPESDNYNNSDVISDSDVQPKPIKHPAKFSSGLMPTAALLLGGGSTPMRVLDPFAGVGGVHELRDCGMFETVGVEIEPEWASQHPDTICGDSRDLAAAGIGDESFDAVVTSPTYGNKMAQKTNHLSDASERRTYSSSLGRLPSAASTAGFRWHDTRYREIHEQVWAECFRVLVPSGLLVLNFRDPYNSGVLPVSGWHLHTLIGLGFRILSQASVTTPSHGGMGGSHIRVGDGEVLTLLQREPV